MELVIEPDLYSPSIDDKGNYVDKIPSFTRIKKGLQCPCGARKDKIYETYSVFSAHTKTKNHQKWLENLNLNKANYYIENEQLKETIQNQRLIIAKMEKDLNTRTKTIDYLTQQLTKTNNPTNNNTPTVTDLIDFD
jgi:inner membrane protein involved in colicin E2 resistance